MATPSKSRLWIFLGLFLLFFLYYFQSIGAMHVTFWDEGLHVNAARAYLTTSKPYPIPDHPPFGKELDALGIMMFGDNPVGWRFFAVFFGSLACTLISYLVFRLTRRMGVALFVAALLFLEPLFVVHFRMGQLDAALTGLLVLATVLTYQFYAGKKLRMWMVYPVTVVLGLALGVKLLTLFFLPFLWGLMVYRLYREPAAKKNILHVTLAFAIIPLFVFQCSFWVLGYTTGETIDLVRFMFAWHKSARGPEPFFSRWYEWLYIKNPVWYYITRLKDGDFHGVLVTGNFVLWIGAEVGAVYAVIRNYKRPEIWMLACLILVQFLLYTQKTSTYIHYMTEILPFLYVLMGVAIGDLFDRYGTKYRRVLQVDLGLYFIAALVIFYNYWPFIWGRTFPAEKYGRISGREIAPLKPSPESAPMVTPSPSPEDENSL